MSITADLYNVRVRFEPETLELLKKAAAQNYRSVAAEIRFRVEAHMDEYGPWPEDKEASAA